MGAVGAARSNTSGFIAWEVSSIPDSPIDVRGAGLGTMMPTNYKQTSQNYYDAAAAIIQKSDVENLEASNISKIQELTEKILKEVNSQGNISCYRYAATTAAILDKAGIPYECQVGAAVSESRLTDKDIKNRARIGSNHVWIKTEAGIIERFTGQGSNIIHLNISDEIKFKK